MIIKNHAVKTYYESGGISPRILKLGIRYRKWTEDFWNAWYVTTNDNSL